MTKQDNVYGGALYDLAKEEGLTEKIAQELSAVLDIFDENPDYWRFLGTLSISKQERCGALEEALGGKIEAYLLNFIKILCENGHIAALRSCAAEYRRRYNEDHGIVEVCAVTAVPMNENLHSKLLEKLQAVLGQTVELKHKVDPACMGGILLELPGRQLDGTVRHRLDALRKELNTAAL